MEKTDWLNFSKIENLPFAIFGAGGYGIEVFCTLQSVCTHYNFPFEFIGFFDDGLEKNSNNGYGVILGGTKELNEIQYKFNLFVAVSNPVTRFNIVSKIENPFVVYPNLIFYDFRIFDKKTIVIGKGNIFFSKCSISVMTEVGDFNILNGSVSIGHNTKIGSFNTALPGVKISGLVNVSDFNQFGMNTAIVQKVKIGNRNNFAPNSVVLRDIKDNGTFFQGTLKKL